MTRREVLAGGLLLALSAVTAFAGPVPRRSAEALIAAARGQVGATLRYDPRYERLAYPGGDVDRASGVCTDVLVRAYRDAFGLDLQELVNRDMSEAFAAYPNRWGLQRPDTNIDHRRVPNLETFFTRAGARLPLPGQVADWQPGDTVSSLIGNRLPHIGIVSDRRVGARPLIIHNIGSGAREEDALTAHRIIGRFRWALDA